MDAERERLVVSEAGDAFPAAALLTGRGFVTGKSGSGKSNTASVLAEELLERGFPFLVVDTDGEYHGLAAEYDVLHVGSADDGGLAVTPETADAVAEIALDDQVPVILDVSGFADAEEGNAVVRETVQALFDGEKRHRIPFLLFVEEIHEYLPEQGSGSAVGEALVRVAKRGRKRGLGICGLSQRPAAVDKEFVSQCDWIAWHRLTWENDVAVVRRLLGGDAAETVTALADGEALVTADWLDDPKRIQFRRQRISGAGSTPGLDRLREGASSGRGKGGGSGGTGSDDAGKAGNGDDGAARIRERVSAERLDRLTARSGEPEPDAGAGDDSGGGENDDTAADAGDGERRTGNRSSPGSPSPSGSASPSPPGTSESAGAVEEFGQLLAYALRASVRRTRRGIGGAGAAVATAIRDRSIDATPRQRRIGVLLALAAAVLLVGLVLFFRG